MGYSVEDLEATLTLDRSPFSRGIKEAIAEGERFEGREFQAKAGLEDRPFKTRVGGLYSDMRKMARQRATPKVDVDVTGAMGLAQVRKQIASLPERKDVTVNVHAKRAVSALGSIVRAATSVKATAVASLVAIAPAAVMAGVAIGGVGVAAIGVLGPLALLGVGMAAAFKKGGPEIKAFKAEFKGLKQDFASALGPGAMEGFKGLTSMFANVRTVLAPLRGDFTKLGQAVGDMFRSFGRGLSTLKSQKFFADMTRAATKAVPLIGRAFRGLGAIFANIATAAMPLLLKGLEKLADWLGKAAKKTGDIDALRATFEKGAEALGQFWKIAKNVGDILASVFKAGESGSSDFLAALQRATRGLATFFASKDGQEILKKTLASLVVFIEEIAKALPTLVRAFGTLLDIAIPIYKVATGIVKVLSKLPGGEAIGALALGFLAWKGPIGTAMLALSGLRKLLGKVIKQAGQKIAFRVGTSAAGQGVAGAAGGAAGQKAVGKGAATAAGTAGGTAGGSFLTRFLARVKGLPGKLVGLFKTLGPKILPAIGAALAGIPALFGKLLPKIGQAFAKIPGLIGKVLPKIGTAFMKLGPLLLRLIPRVLVGVGAAFVTAAGGWIVLLVTTIATLIWALLPKKVKDAIWKALKGAGKWVVGAIKTGAGAIKDAGVWIAKTVAKGVVAAAKFVAKGAADLAKKAWGAIKKTAGKFADAGKTVIAAVAKGVKGAAKLWWGAVKAVAKKAWEIIKGFAKDFVTVGKLLIKSVAKGIKSVAKDVWEGVKAVGKGAWKAIKWFVKGFFETGKALVEGLISGIKSMAQKAVDAAKAVVEAPMKAAKSLLGIGSPSKAFATIGSQIGEGLVQGLGASQGSVAAAMAKTVNAGLKAAHAARDAARGKLAYLERLETMRAPPPPTRAAREAEVIGRIDAARGARDEQGHLLNQPPPGVARRQSADEREAASELYALREEFAREDLEAAANVQIKALIPSDPRTLRDVRRGVARGVRHGRRRRPRTRRVA